MQKLPLLFCLIGLFSNPFFGQYSTTIDSLCYGRYNVGHQVETYFNSSIDYQLNPYKGALPFQVSIWFPSAEDGQQPLTRDNYLSGKLDAKMKQVSDSLDFYAREGLLNYGICINYKNLSLRKPTQKDQLLKDAILNLPCKASSSTTPKSGKWPCVFYHHGAGGDALENLILCEYLASYGFVVVSSNFNWPSETKNTEISVSSDYEKENTLFVLDKIKQLNYVDSEQIYYVGHSWGAQVGLALNNKTSLFNAFIILETTLEHAQMSEIPKYWPDLHEHIESNKANMVRPNYVFCSKTFWSKRKWVTPRYEYFRTLEATPQTFITYSTPLGHAAYTDCGVIRAEFADTHKQKDAKIIRDQYNVYLEMCSMIKLILQQSVKGQQTDFSRHPKFIIEELPQKTYGI
ncbi:MAG: hypothetical protein CL853_03880 [Crocinitomicaceae bacterium]|nr:hypothetical protein [Crocinitomicaceae bacterium]|tara:strand:+ start:10537 stop:11745 length:1209 start_codon:yes stop_codon:yes gene_type:complete